MEVAYQGEPGCYSEAATQRFFGAHVRCVPCGSFAAAIDALGAGRAARAVIPVENVLAGSLHANLDLIVGAGARVVGEVEVDVRHCLLVRADADCDAGGEGGGALRVARSHDMALRQCSEYLARARIGAEVAGDTAGAARALAAAAPEDARGICAIASEGAARRYGLRVVARDIGNQLVNFTRFLVLAPAAASTPQPAPKAGARAKTSIVFALDHGPGRLCQALGVFAFHDIDLCRIESRHVHSLDGTGAAARAHPAHADARWQYLFYLDFNGSTADKHVDLALQALQCKTSFYRLLGSYEMFDHRAADKVEDAKVHALHMANGATAEVEENGK